MKPSSEMSRAPGTASSCQTPASDSADHAFQGPAPSFNRRAATIRDVACERSHRFGQAPALRDSRGTQGPWYMADFEAGSGPAARIRATPDGSPRHHPHRPTTTTQVPFAVGFLKNRRERSGARNGRRAIRQQHHHRLRRSSAQGDWATKVPWSSGLGATTAATSWGTFYEGAVLSGWPSNEAEAAVLAEHQVGWALGVTFAAKRNARKNAPWGCLAPLARP